MAIPWGRLSINSIALDKVAAFRTRSTISDTSVLEEAIASFSVTPPWIDSARCVRWESMIVGDRRLWLSTGELTRP